MTTVIAMCKSCGHNGSHEWLESRAAVFLRCPKCEKIRLIYEKKVIE